MLENLNGVDVIADDILVYGRGETYEEALADHDKNLKALLQRARDENLKFNKDKLQLRLSSVPYMGHLITAEGLKPDPQKTLAIQFMQKPKDQAAVQRYLGFVNYWSKFLPKLSTLCEPLRELTKKNADWVWSDKQDIAFETIKNLVIKAPVLPYYDVNEEVTIQCDASQDGLGCVLLQNGQPVAFASKTMTETEKRYAQIEKECLAIVYACEKFNQYILEKSTKIETDHKPSEIIFKKSLLCAPKRLQRMLLRLQKYSLVVVYRVGSQLYLADFLSRAPLTDTDHKSDIADSNFTVFNVNRLFRIFTGFENVNMCDDIGVTQIKLDLIKQATVKDENLQVLKSVIMRGWPVTKQSVPLCVRHYWVFRDELSISDDIIFKGCRILVPKALRPTMLKRIHASHMGTESCLRKARDILFWPQMSHDMKNYVLKCEVCNELQPNLTKEPMMFHSIPNGLGVKLQLMCLLCITATILLLLIFSLIIGNLMN